jgi:hypothetical protein
MKYCVVVNLAYEGGGGVGEAFLLAAQGDSLLQTVKEGLRCVEHCNTFPCPSMIQRKEGAVLWHSYSVSMASPCRVNK